MSSRDPSEDAASGEGVRIKDVSESDQRKRVDGVLLFRVSQNECLATYL